MQCSLQGGLNTVRLLQRALSAPSLFWIRVDTIHTAHSVYAFSSHPLARPRLYGERVFLITSCFVTPADQQVPFGRVLLCNSLQNPQRGGLHSRDRVPCFLGAPRLAMTRQRRTVECNLGVTLIGLLRSDLIIMEYVLPPFIHTDVS